MAIQSFLENFFCVHFEIALDLKKKTRWVFLKVYPDKKYMFLG